MSDDGRAAAAEVVLSGVDVLALSSVAIAEDTVDAPPSNCNDDGGWMVNGANGACWPVLFNASVKLYV